MAVTAGPPPAPTSPPPSRRIAWHARLEARVLIAVAIIAGVSLVAVLWATTKVVAVYSLGRSADDLTAARTAFDRLAEARRHSASKTTRLIVELPTFRGLITDVNASGDSATLNYMTRQYCEKLGAQFCFVSDTHGRWVAQAGDVPAAAAATAAARVTREADDGRSSSAMAVIDRRLYLLVAEPAMFGELEVLGALTAGFLFDDAVAAELADVTNTEVSFVCDDVCGTSLPRSAQAALTDDLRAGLEAAGLTSQPRLKTIGSAEYVGGLYPLEPGAGAALLLLKDWAPTAQALREIDEALVWVTVVVLGAAVFGALAFSHRVTRPLRRLTRVADAIAAGDWTKRAPSEGPAEMRHLADAFNQMAEGLVDWNRKVQERDDQLRQAQKMEAVGRLAGGVAHDFNNLLTAILGYADLLLEQLPPDDPVRPRILEIQKAGRTAASLTKDLLAFSRKQVVQPVVLELNEIISGTGSLLTHLVGENIELKLDLGDRMPVIKADPGQINQVLLNLVVNARDAMPDGGRLTISTRGGVKEVLLSVRDTGCGMTDDIRNHIFEPFFTTKSTGHGTGLGLATVYGIVQQCGGRLSVDSAAGSGSTFTIAFPAAEGTAAQPPPVLDRPVTTGCQSETVLLVEDNEVVRTMAREALTSAGYSVLEARNGAEALRLVSGRLGDVAMVVTDVVMPVMGGRELVGRLRALKPDIKVIFTSGYASDPDTAEHARSSGAGFIQKPFVPSALRREVREILDAELV